MSRPDRQRLRLLVHPVVIGSGTPFFPLDTPLALRLTETRVFRSGVTYLGHAR